jgi:Domain of unknown function (DUF4381)
MMAETQLYPGTEAALGSLADIVTPAPVSWMPQTWGWAALAILVLGVITTACWRWLRWYKINRYRRAALVELHQLEKNIGDPALRRQIVGELPVLLKRVALAAWPREEVASLSGTEWAQFLGAETPDHPLGTDLGRVLADLEYRSDAEAAAVSPESAGKLIAAAGRWIENHHVPA